MLTTRWLDGDKVVADVHDCARVDPNTGRVSVRWRVPKDLAASDAYVVKVQSHPRRPRPRRYARRCREVITW